MLAVVRLKVTLVLIWMVVRLEVVLVSVRVRMLLHDPGLSAPSEGCTSVCAQGAAAFEDAARMRPVAAAAAAAAAAAGVLTLWLLLCMACHTRWRPLQWLRSRYGWRDRLLQIAVAAAAAAQVVAAQAAHGRGAQHLRQRCKQDVHPLLLIQPTHKAKQRGGGAHAQT